MNQITIVPPSKNASEVAVETRNALQAIIDRVQGDAGSIPPLSKEEIKQFKAAGAANFDHIIKYSYFRKIISPDDAELQARVHALYTLQYTLGSYCVPDASEDFRKFSYHMEGVAGRFSKYWHDSGFEWTEDLHRFASLSMSANYYRSTDEERFAKSLIGHDLGFGGPARQLYYTAGDLGKYSKMAVLHDKGPAHYAFAATVLHYEEADGPWVCGFLSSHDAARVRFSRKRLGAWLATLGLSAAEVRDVVEQAKTKRASAGFYVYPNDVDWEGVYTNGPDSCMAAGYDEYETWDEIHPVSVYSSAYFGSGDNGLALFTVKDSDDTHLGRGIWNMHTGKIVRWYGDANGARALTNLGINDDYNALGGSWLALQTNDGRFIHPYVDGACAYGEIDMDAGRVYLHGDDNDEETRIEVQTTSGSSRMNLMVYARDTGDYEERSNCVRLEEQNEWVTAGWRENCDDTDVCPVLDEYIVSRQQVMLDGESCYISWRAFERFASYGLREVDLPEGFPRKRINPEWQARAEYLRAFVTIAEYTEEELPPKVGTAKGTAKLIATEIDRSSALGRLFESAYIEDQLVPTFAWGTPGLARE